MKQLFPFSLILVAILSITNPTTPVSAIEKDTPTAVHTIYLPLVMCQNCPTQPIFGNQIEAAMTTIEVISATGPYPIGSTIVHNTAPWEPAMWSWTGSPMTLTVPFKFGATATRMDGKVQVWLGPMVLTNTIGMTLRQLTVYPVDSPFRVSEQSLLNTENAWSTSQPTPVFTCSGNLTTFQYTSTEWANACNSLR